MRTKLAYTQGLAHVSRFTAHHMIRRFDTYAFLVHKECMGTVFRFRDVRIIIRTKDHNPPHVHVIRGDAEAKIEIHGQEIVFSRGFTRNDLKRITAFLAAQKDKLLEAWEAIHSEEE